MAIGVGIRVSLDRGSLDMPRMHRPAVAIVAVLLAVIMLAADSTNLGTEPSDARVCARLTASAYVRINPTSGATLITTDPATARQSMHSGFTDDLGQPFTVSSGPGPELIGVQELVSRSTGDRLYTSDTAATGRALDSGYQDTGIAFYVPTRPTSCSSPIYRMTKTGVSRYPTSPEERERLAHAGWISQAVAFPAVLSHTWSWPVSAGKGPLDQPPLVHTGNAGRAYQSSSDPTTRRLLYQIAATPTAIWLGGTAGDGSAVARIETEAAAQHKTPQFVLYAIPDRDCGGYGAGGLGGSEAYEQWIREVRAGIAGRPTLIIVEPDAIGMSCLDAGARAERTAMLRYAISTLSQDPDTWVYLHAGSSRLDPRQVVPALMAVGVGEGRGLAINVSGYGATAGEMAYGDELVRLLAQHGVPGMHYVIDTSRNGLGGAVDGTADAAHSFCNQRGRALGQRPTPWTGNDRADAFLWIKPPGESDGNCFPADPKTGWDQDYALDLVRRSLAEETIAELPLPT